MGMGGFDEDVLDGEGVLVAGIELAAAVGAAELDPAGDAVAGAAEAAGFAGGLQQHGRIR